MKPGAARRTHGPAATFLALSLALLVLCVVFDGDRHPASASHGFPHATVKVWDTAVPLPPSLSLGLEPGESVEDPTGLTGHGTSYPTIVTVYAKGSHPLGPSGISYWNPDGNVFVWYGKTFGFPSGIDLNRAGPKQPAQSLVFGTFTFGPGDVWIAGQENEPLYVHLAGTNKFRTYGTSDSLTPPSGKVWGVKVDQATGHVFLAQPSEGRISRLDPVANRVTFWVTGGAPAYVTVDGAGRPYATLSAADVIVRVNAGPDGVLGTLDDTITVWKVPSRDGTASFRRVPCDPTVTPGCSDENPNGVITADAEGNIWFTESNSNEVGRLSPGPDGLLGTADDVICEYTTTGLLNPQQIAAAGTGNLLQAYFTEADGNSTSVLTQAEAALAPYPTQLCTTAPASETTPLAIYPDRTPAIFDEEVTPLETAIVPTVHDVPGVGGPASGTTTTATGEVIPPILRFSPMPNPILSADGASIGDAGNGFPSGMTGVYAANRVAGAYLQGNKHFEVESGALVAPPRPAPSVPGRMTGGGSLTTSDGRRVKYGFVLHCILGQGEKDVLHVTWEDGNTFHLDGVTSASCSDDPAIGPSPAPAGFDTHTGGGTGRYKGVDGASVTWTFTDAGGPGSNDSASLLINDALGNAVLSVSGKLARGDNKAHPGN